METGREEAKRRGQPEMTYLESNIDLFRAYGQMMESSYGKPGRGLGLAGRSGCTGIRG